jgi:hypothetical protein
MEKDASQPPPGAGANHLEKYRGLVTLQTQIVALAHRNQETERSCVELARLIAHERALRQPRNGWSQRRFPRPGAVLDWLLDLIAGTPRRGTQRTAGQVRRNGHAARAGAAKDRVVRIVVNE